MQAQADSVYFDSLKSSAAILREVEGYLLGPWCRRMVLSNVGRCSAWLIMLVLYFFIDGMGDDD